MVECPKCKSNETSKVKEWNIKPTKKVGPALLVAIYQCGKCMKRFRVVTKL